MNKDVYIGSGSLAGKGVYAARDFKENEVVITYNLKPLSDKQFAELPESERQFVHVRDEQRYLYSEPERYVNHSNTPNTYQDFDIDADRALVEIRKGEMITTDARKDDL